MKVRVEMLAFCEDGTFREVQIPQIYINRTTDTQKVLDLVFEFGQNEKQPMNCPSVSIGDVIHYAGEYWLVRPLGFEQIWDTQLEQYRSIPRIDRQFVDVAVNPHDGCKALKWKDEE